MPKRPESQASGSQAHMVDTSAKPETLRESTAAGEVRMRPETLEAVAGGRVSKGDVLAVARIAGIMAAKQTPSLVPLCHPLLLDEVVVDFALNFPKSAVEITAQVKCTGKTGVEMESLVAVMASALTIYDMCKPVDPAMRIENVRLLRKSGGKSGVVVLE